MYSAPIAIPNGGEVLLKVHCYGYSMDDSATWFAIEASAGLTDVLCRQDLPDLGSWSSAEQSEVPYTCATTGAETWTWDTTVQKTAPSPRTAFRLRSLHYDGGHCDHSELWRMELLVR